MSGETKVSNKTVNSRCIFHSEPRVLYGHKNALSRGGLPSPVYSPLMSTGCITCSSIRLGKSSLRKWNYYTSLQLVTLRADHEQTQRCVSLPTS